MHLVEDDSPVIMSIVGEERTALSAVLPNNLHFKGRVRMSHLESFFEEVHSNLLLLEKKAIRPPPHVHTPRNTNEVIV